MILAMEVVKAKCRKCGKLVRSDEMILDPVYKLMVCPACVKEREIKEKMPIISKREERTIDFDREDEYLQKMQRLKSKEVPKLKLIQEGNGFYICPKCNFKFKYPTKTMPTRCPYCDASFNY